MSEETKSVSVGIRILGIFSILAGIITLMIGGGVLFSMLSKQFLSGSGLTVSLFLMISGVLKIWAIILIWKIRKSGVLLYAISEILLLIALITFLDGHSEKVMLLNGLISFIWSVLFIVIYGLSVRSKTPKV